MKICLFIQIGIALIIGVLPFQNAAAQTAAQQLGGQSLQDEIDQQKAQWGGDKQRQYLLGNGGTGSAAPGGSTSQQQAVGQMGNMMGSMLSHPSGGITAGSGQQNAGQMLNNSGVYLLNHNNPAGAVSAFQKALTQNPGDPTIEKNLELAEQKLNGAATAAQTSQTLGQLLNVAPADSSGSGTDAGNGDSASAQIQPANPHQTAADMDQALGGSSGIKGLPGIYLNDDTGNGNNKPYGIPGLPGIYLNGPGQGSGLTQPGQSPGADTTPQPAQTAAAPAPAGTDTAPQPAGQTTPPTSTAPTINLGNAEKPDFDGNAGGNGAIAGSGGSSSAPSSADPFAGASQQTGGQSGIVTPGENLKDAVADNQSGQQAVQMGVPSDKAGLTPITGGSATPGTDTKASDQLVSAAANGENSGQNFDSGGGYAGSSSTVDLSGTTPTNADNALMKNQWQMSIDPRYKTDSDVQQYIRDLWRDARSTNDTIRIPAEKKLEAILTDQLKVEGWRQQQIADFFANFNTFTSNDGPIPKEWGNASPLAQQIDALHPIITSRGYQDLLSKDIVPAQSIKADVSYMASGSQTGDDCVFYAIANGAQVPVGQVKDAFDNIVKDLGMDPIEERNNPDLATTSSDQGGNGGLNPLEELLTAGKVGTVTAVPSDNFAQALESTHQPIVTTINGNHEVLVTGVYQTAAGGVFYSVMDSNLKGYDNYTAYVDKQSFEGKMTWGGYIITP